MPGEFTMPDLTPFIPEIIMVAGALLILLLDLVIRKKEVLGVLAIATATVVSWQVLEVGGTTFSGMFVADTYSAFFKLIFMSSLVLGVLVSMRYIEDEGINLGEYYVLMMFSTFGMMIMASAGDLISLYLGLELMALSTYVLAGFKRQSIFSNEASIKYFLLGAFASAFLLFGISLTYGATGTTSLTGIAAYLETKGLFEGRMLSLALLFYTVAFGFKIAAVPFHMWAPDVYEGAPTSVTAFMSAGPKAAGFAALGRVFLIAFASYQVDVNALLIPLAVLTMAVGNVLALVQTNIKRLLAYSSIAHAGYVLLGIIAGTPAGVSGVMTYLFIYTFMNIGAFALVILLRSEEGRGERISDYTGLGKSHPLVAFLMLIFMFSLTGIPPTAGFIGKFMVFKAAVGAGHTGLVVFAVLMSSISAFYYLRIVMLMYMREPEMETPLAPSTGLSLAVTVTTLAVVILGVLPGRLLDAATNAAMAWF